MVWPIRNARFLGIVVILLCAAFTAEAYGQEAQRLEDAQGAAQPPAEGADVDAVLQRVAGFYQEVKTLQVNATITQEMESEVVQQKHELVYEVQIKPPSRYAYRLVQGDVGATVVSRRTLNSLSS